MRSNRLAQRLLALGRASKPRTFPSAQRKSVRDLFSRRDRSYKELCELETRYLQGGPVREAIDAYALMVLSNGWYIDGEDETLVQDTEDRLNELDLSGSLWQGIVDSLVFGDAFQELATGAGTRADEIVAIIPRPAKMFDIVSDEYGMLAGYRQFRDGGLREEYIDLDPRDMLHISLFHVGGSRYGLSLIASAKDDIDRDTRMICSLVDSIEAHGKPRYHARVGQPGEDVPQIVLDRIADQLDDLQTNCELVTVADTNITVLDSAGVSNTKVYSDLTIQRLACALGVPEEILGLGRGSTEACYSEDTETLTENGWKFWWQIGPEEKVATYNPESEMLEFHVPLGFYLYDHNGPMVHFNNDNHDILVTPNHRMYSATSHAYHHGGKFEIKEAQELGGGRAYFRVAVAGVEAPPSDLSEDEVRFMGYFLSEGCASKNVPGHRISFSQKKEDSAAVMGEVLRRMGFRESFYDDKGYEWVKHDKELKAYLNDNCGTNSKDLRIPQEYKDLPADKLAILLDALILGDGTVDGRPGRTHREYCTTSPQLADDVQEIAFKLGYCAKLKAQVDPRPNRSTLYRINISTKAGRSACIEPESITYEHYVGRVYCFEVPNHLFVTRRNGKIAIQGNTATVRQRVFENKIGTIQKRLERIYNEQLIDRLTGRPGEVRLKFNDISPEDELREVQYVTSVLNADPIRPLATRKWAQQRLRLPVDEEEDDAFAF